MAAKPKSESSRGDIHTPDAISEERLTQLAELLDSKDGAQAEGAVPGAERA